MISRGAGVGVALSDADADLREPIAHTIALLQEGAAAMITRPHPLLCVVRRGNALVIFAPAAVWDEARHLLRPFTRELAAGRALIILLGEPRDADLAYALGKGLASLLPERPERAPLRVALHNAFELIEAKTRAESRGKWLNQYQYELGELIECSRAIETERDIDKLLGVILEKSRFVTSADAGSIYVVESDGGASPKLRFKLSQNDSVRFDSREFVIPLSARSMAGAAAIFKKAINIVDVYQMPAGSPFGFDRSFDDKTGYRTQSVLSLPLISRTNEAIGVIQLINKKRDKDKRLFGPDEVNEQVIPFDGRSEELVGMLAAQAGLSLENAMLLEEIRLIFEGFVRASVEAIEQRDPTTSGHSRRVCDLTLGLARAVERTDSGPYREAAFSAEDLREIEYASLLHDFGKIGVREQVLIKAKKLYDFELEIIKQRIELAFRSLETDILRRKLDFAQNRPPEGGLEAMEAEFAAQRLALSEALRTIETANEPTVLHAGDFTKIEALSKLAYASPAGDLVPILSAAEVSALSVPRGSLTPTEIDEIRSHVTNTYDFLSTIPWGKRFARVPVIARSHHERLNGTGYPNRLRAEEIPLPSKLMTISDIFDALTASDRPYKRAVPVDRALDILGGEVRDKHIDGDLVKIFYEARVWEPVMAAAAGRRR